MMGINEEKYDRFTNPSVPLQGWEGNIMASSAGGAVDFRNIYQIMESGTTSFMNFQPLFPETSNNAIQYGSLNLDWNSQLMSSLVLARGF